MVVDPMANMACSVQVPIVDGTAYNVQQAAWSEQPYVETNPFLQVNYNILSSGGWFYTGNGVI